MPTFAETIQSKLTTQFIGEKITALEELTSTNEWAMTQLDKSKTVDLQNGEVIIAEKQSAGKGRMGRTWFSPPSGNLYMSIILFPQLASSEIARLTLVAGAACNEALNQLTKKTIELKWPNDLYHQDKKLGGILSECRTSSDGRLGAVIGIGINIHFNNSSLPSELQNNATSLYNITGAEIDRSGVAAAILNQFEVWYQKLLDDQWPEVVDYCDRHNTLKDQIVTVQSAGQSISGRVLGLSKEGHLRVQDESGREHILLEGDATLCS